MTESADFNPGIWTPHNFDNARRAYGRTVQSSTQEARASGVKSSDLIPDRLVTLSKSPVVIKVDVTASMGGWPDTIFSKLGYFEIEGQEYLGPTMEVSFGAVGDATKGDNYPLQVRPFTKGLDLRTQLAELKHERGGGGGGNESYELPALYYARRVTMPNADQPIMIYIADEQPYPYVTTQQAKTYVRENLTYNLPTKAVFDELKSKFSVYLIRKSYDDPYLDKEIQNNWVSLIGEDHIAPLDDPNRVVDVIFGIFAAETRKVRYFREEIEGRQRPEQVDTVYRSLDTIHRAALMLPEADPNKNYSGRSTMHRPTSGESSAPLI